MVLTAHMVLMSLMATVEEGEASAPFAPTAGFLSTLRVASNEASASSGNGARRLEERPCLRVWVSLSRRNRLDILFHHDWKAGSEFVGFHFRSRESRLTCLVIWNKLSSPGS